MIDKMSKELVTFGDSAVEKHIFHQRKSLISIVDIIINKTIISKKVSFA